MHRLCVSTAAQGGRSNRYAAVPPEPTAVYFSFLRFFGLGFDFGCGGVEMP